MDEHDAQRGYASPRLARGLAALTVVVGIAWAVGTVVYTVNAATRAGAEVVVPVTVVDPAALRFPSPPEADQGQRPTLATAGAGSADGLRLEVVDPPQSTPVVVETRMDTAVLRAQGSTLTEQVLSRAGFAVSGVCAGLGALLLRSPLLSIAEGQPFRRGNAARIAGIGGLALVSGVVAPLLFNVATTTVLSRLDLRGGGFGTTVRLSLGPILVALFALVLAEAFRRGGELARDADGLV